MRVDDPELDARIAALYDAENVWRDDDEFFSSLAPAGLELRVLDLGCGSGRLTTALAQRGHCVMGIDPNPAFLNMASQKPGADLVTWVRGTSRDAPDGTFDLALMTSHVAQEILTDDEWTSLLRDLRRALVPGGTLAFDTRDPAAKAWESWASSHAGVRRTPTDRGTVVDSDIRLTYENEIAGFDDAAVESDGSRDFNPRAIEFAAGTSWRRAWYGYRFRSVDLIKTSLDTAGFHVDHLYGGWHREPVGNGAGEIVVIARTRATYPTRVA